MQCMSLLNRKSGLILGLLTTLLALGASAIPVFAWNACSLALSPISQSTTVGTSSTTTFTYLLTYSGTVGGTQYPSSFTLSATSSNPAWTILSVTSPVPTVGTSNSISQTISVVVKASAVASSTTITVSATNISAEAGGDFGANCNTQTKLTATAVTHGVPNSHPASLFYWHLPCRRSSS